MPRGVLKIGDWGREASGGRRVVDLLVRFLEQGDGKLSGQARQKEFAALTEAEIEEVETLYERAFGGSHDP